MTELTFHLASEYIELQQLLKVMDMIGSGGEVRAYLAYHSIEMNGEPEKRRSRKIRAGDVLVIDGETSISVK